MVHLDHRGILLRQGLHRLPQLPGHLGVGQAEAVGYHHIKQHVGVVWAGGDPQVVDRQGWIQRLGRRLHLLPQGVGALIIDHWVGVDHRLNVVLGL